MTYSTEARARWRKTILAKGKDVSDRLAALLAGEDAELADIDLLHGGEPGERPKERLRRIFDHLMATLRRVDAPDFGRCTTCGAAMPERELDGMPWAEVCGGCARGSGATPT